MKRLVLRRFVDTCQRNVLPNAWLWAIFTIFPLGTSGMPEVPAVIASLCPVFLVLSVAWMILVNIGMAARVLGPRQQNPAPKEPTS